MTLDPKRILRRLIPIILIGITGNILFTIYTSEIGLFQLLSQFSIGYLMLGLALAFFPWLCHIFRLKIWCGFLGNQLSNKDCLRIVIVQDVGNSITPTAVGGTPIKYGLLLQKGFSHAQTSIIITLQILEDLVFLFTSLPLALYFTGGFRNPMVIKIKDDLLQYSTHLFWVIPLLILLVLAAGGLIRKSKKERTDGKSWGYKLRKTWLEFLVTAKFVIQKGKLRFLASASIMFIEWTCRFSIPIALAYGLGVEADFIQLFLLQWVIFFAMLITPTPGATGGAEAIFYYLFIPFVPGGLIGFLITGWRFLSYYLVTLVGAVILQTIGVIDKE
ncbi:MAG: lysylphosphatidylglycerol synthase transmembrane domain-containing protein [Bacteroidetes bacterium]|nr:lysylphosphatidylglycerol synthase transmembrane domain-containing protein [Bacteroidota bacterium]MDA1120096.1 lysylphosphatidylglycerol synthase transmembrane domain-containing protein [Bacteroidota bacterium]